MEGFYLKTPTLSDEKKWIDYVKEVRKYHPNIKPLSFTENMNYKEWLDRCDKGSKGIDLKKDMVPYSNYFFMQDNRIIGNVNIRHNIDTDLLSRYGGHIGYRIRPSFQRQGYGPIMLYLALKKCDELGLDKVLVTCKEDNIGSYKTIESNFGELEDLVYIPEENSYFRKYWIDVKEAIKNSNYKDKEKNL